MLWLFCMYVREKGQQRWIGQLTEKVAERTTAEIAFYIVWHSQADKKQTSIRQRFDVICCALGGLFIFAVLLKMLGITE